MWEYLFNQDELAVLKDLNLRNEIINPIYEELRSDLKDVEVNSQLYPDMINYYEELINIEEENLSQLHVTRDKWEQKIDNLENDFANYEKIYQNEAASYRDLKDEALNLELDIESMESELSFYEKTFDELEKEVEILQNEIWKAETEEEELDQKVSDVQTTYNNLTDEVEEARLSEVQQTSDVKFIAEAVPPKRPLNKNTKLNIAIAGVLSIMMGVFIVFFQKFLKDE
ncbi:MAG: GNVR domain-containing protein, partial [bacterium]